jgi:hypothetical protein
MNMFKIANEYGNIDVRFGVPKGYVHVEGLRLAPLCRKLGITHALALVGLRKHGGFWRPQYIGGKRQQLDAGDYVICLVDDEDNRQGVGR